MSHDLFIDIARLVPVGKALARGLLGNSRMFREPTEVVIRYGDAWMTAAIAGALLTIELQRTLSVS
jgi:hypothetical protein